MTQLVLGPFQGEVPGINAALIAMNQAQVAENVNLQSGSLKSWRKSQSVDILSATGTLQTLYRYEKLDGTIRWCSWSQDVDVLPGPIAGDTARRVYFSGTDMPRVFDNSLVDSGAGTQYPNNNYRLSVPAPAAAPVAALGSGGTGTARDVAYVYTYVRKWASSAYDESQPSPASNIVTALQGQHITVNGFSAVPSAEHGITHIFIYRVNTGTSGAEYQKVDEIAIATASYDDSKSDTQLGAVLETTNWAIPPNDLKGLLSLPNGSFAGFSGKQVCVSVPYQVHSYPTAYRVTVPYDIVAIGNIGNMIVVATSGFPYLINCNDPGTMSNDVLPSLFPCLSKRGLVSTERGVFYPTQEGVAVVQYSGGSDIATTGMITPEKWTTEYFPTEMQARAWNGYYIAFYKTSGSSATVTGKGLMFSYRNISPTKWSLSNYATATFIDPKTGIMYYISPDDVGINNVYQWDAMVERKVYTWRSKRFIATKAMNWGAFRILADFGGLTPAEQADYAAQRQSIIAANSAMLAGDDLGSINGSALDELALDGDNLLDVPPASSDTPGVTLNLYAKTGEADELVHAETVTDTEIHTLPADYLAKEFYLDLISQAEIREFRMATSVTEMADA